VPGILPILFMFIKFFFVFWGMLVVLCQPTWLLAMVGSQSEARTLTLGWEFISEIRQNNFNISRTDIISVSGLLSYPGLSSVIIDLENRRRGEELSAEYAIDEHCYLEARLRVVDGEVAVPVGNGDNVYSSGRNFPEFSLGINRLILPETPVTPAVRIGFYNEYGQYNLRRLQTSQPTQQIVLVDADFQEIGVLATLGISRHIGRHKILEPYGIVGFGWREVSLFDNSTAEKISGQKVLLMSTVGFNYCPRNIPERKIFVEYKFGTTTGWSAGIRFKL